VGADLTVTDLFYDGVRCVQEAGWAAAPGRWAESGMGKGWLPRRANELSADGNPGSCAGPLSAWR